MKQVTQFFLEGEGPTLKFLHLARSFAQVNQHEDFVFKVSTVETIVTRFLTIL